MISKVLLKEFETIVGKDNVFQDETDRITYSYDAAVLEPAMPALVLRPAQAKPWARWCGCATSMGCR